LFYTVARRKYCGVNSHFCTVGLMISHSSNHDIGSVLHRGMVPMANYSRHASVWRWRRKAAGGRRNGMSEAVRRSGAASARRKRARLRFSSSVRDERALHGCERALVADIEPKGFAF